MRIFEIIAINQRVVFLPVFSFSPVLAAKILYGHWYAVSGSSHLLFSSIRVAVETIHPGSVRVVMAEDFRQRLPVDEAIGPHVQLIAAGSTDSILQAGRKCLVTPKKLAE